ncbi:XK-related protein 7-like [Scleropages formosus]|uniref:XK-related protein n=1 Tax=Scleropages formosus TaxID=113540 RepID=A0A0P7U636_SCLFO|nr:XK-related protein 7-like [Scleropages formosus]
MAAESDGVALSLSWSAFVPQPSPPAPHPHPPPSPRRRAPLFSLSDCCWLLCSLLVLLADAVAALSLCVDYLLRRDYRWCALTLLFVAVPSAVVQVLSFRWFLHDFSESRSSAGGGAATPLSQVWRYLHTLYLGAQSRWQGDGDRRRRHLRLLFESADVSVLRLLESFLKSAPQLVLQLSIALHSHQVLPLQGLCVLAALVSLSWTVASYQKVLRECRDDKAPLSYKAVLVQALWHMFSIGARATAFALFASVFQLYFGTFVVAHWCLMTFWVIQGETDFCMSKWEEIVYDMMVGVIYVFCWFNVREGHERRRLLAYCSVVLAENMVLVALWYLYRGPQTSDSCALLVLCAVACSQALGTFFMLVYYCLLHPDGDARWGCVRGAADEPCEGVATPVPPLDTIAGPPGTLQRTTAEEQADRDCDPPVFRVRPCAEPFGPAPCAPREEGPIILIDLPRKKYPAWDAHFIDRRLRKTILLLESTSPVTPRLQYRSPRAPRELAEYETTV